MPAASSEMLPEQEHLSLDHTEPEPSLQQEVWEELELMAEPEELEHHQ